MCTVVVRFLRGWGGGGFILDSGRAMVCVYGGSTVPKGVGRGRDLATVPRGVGRTVFLCRGRTRGGEGAITLTTIAYSQPQSILEQTNSHVISVPFFVEALGILGGMPA